jgi:hypothetical protein
MARLAENERRCCLEGMMTEQEIIQETTWQLLGKAADEIGRLRALNAELVAALEQIIAHTRTAGSTDPGILKVARAALSRATESK